MGVSQTPVFPQTPNRGFVNIVNADGQNQKTVYTAGANGSKVTSLTAQSTDTSARDLQISVTNGGTSYPITTITVPIGAGNSGAVPAVNLLNTTQFPGCAFDSDGNPYLFLVSGDTLTISALTSVTAAKTITVHVNTAGDF